LTRSPQSDNRDESADDADQSDLRNSPAPGGESERLARQKGPQAFSWICRPGARDFSGMGTVRKGLRSLLDQQARISRLEPERVERSRDGRQTWLDDGAASRAC
jgi:adenine C2-methylase RlmN of 23S rRNA A2503 and tRNA A37